MKNISLQTPEDVKAFSIDLKKELQTRYSDIKQSFILECIAKSFHFADWNTMSALMKQTQEKHSLTKLMENLLQDPEVKAGYDSRKKIVNIGRSLRSARENQNMTQAQLASLLGVEEMEVHRLETGQDTHGDILQTMIDVGEQAEKELLSTFIEQAKTNNASTPVGGWSKKTHIHIDNGGFSLRFHTQKLLLEIESGFYGYSLNTHRFKMSQALCSKMSVCLRSYVDKPDYAYSPTQLFDMGTQVSFADKILRLSNDFTELEIPLNQENSLQLYLFMIQCFEPQPVDILALNSSLLNSMAMRYDHSFGLMTSEQQAKLVKRMENLYSLYAQGLNDSEIETKTSESLITIRQLREEVTGEGFYQPKKLKR